VLVRPHDVPVPHALLPLARSRGWSSRSRDSLPRLRPRAVRRPGAPGVLVVPAPRAPALQHALRVPVPLVHRFLVPAEHV
jgi:hypothetical protein